MKLNKQNRCEEYICDLTKELDLLAKFDENINENIIRFFHHYIVADAFCKKDKCLAIRVPGGTVGSIWIDDNNVITDIYIDTDYVVKTYPNNVNELIKKYIGEVIEYNE